MFKTYTVLLLLFFICCGQNIMAEDCDESGVCKLPGASSETDNNVLSPVGTQTNVPAMYHSREMLFRRYCKQVCYWFEPLFPR